MTGTALDDVHLSYQAADLSSPSATAGEDEEILFGHLRRQLPAEPVYEPTWAPAYPVSTPSEEETEEAEAFLTSADMCSLQSSSLASIDDGESSVLDLVTDEVDDLLATAEGKKCSAHATLVLPAVVSQTYLIGHGDRV
jgi:hypothetical protein